MSGTESVNPEEEVVELELEEDRIVGYLVDEDDNEIGVLYTNDDGEEVEIYYDEIEVEEADAGGTAVEDDSVEMEIDPDAIVYYMVDAKGNELGFVALNEEGEKEEFRYPADSVGRFYLLEELEKKLRKASGVKGSASNLVAAGTNAVGGVVNSVAGKEVIKTTGGKKPAAQEPDDDAVTREDFKDMFSAFKDVAVEGYAAISGVMDQVDDVRDQLDDINPKKRRQNRRARKNAEAAAAQTVIVQPGVSPAYSMPNLEQVAAAESPAPAPAQQAAQTPAPAQQPASTSVSQPAPQAEPAVAADPEPAAE